MNTIKQLLITIAVLLCSATANAQSFEVDGIYYNILSDEDMTVEVSNGKSYSGDINILKNFTLPTHYYKSWESTNHSNSTTSETSYILDVEAGDILTFNWSVSSDDYDYLIITLDGTIIIKKSGALSGNYNKTFNSAGTHTLVIKYTKDHSYTWGKDIGKIYNVQLKSSRNKFCYTTTSIGKNAFYNCTGLTSITIPNSVTTIGQSAFESCYGLTSIEIPNSVTTIGACAFYGCSGLTSITIPNSVTTIGAYAFKNCKSLTSIEIPNSITTIGQSSFNGCTGLTSIVIPNSVTSIGDYVFQYCKSLTSIEIPNSITTIGQSSFNGCTGLTSIVIPNSVTTIGGSAFEGCSGLKKLTIGKNVEIIGSKAFNECTKLKDLRIEDSEKTLELGCNYHSDSYIQENGKGLFHDCPLRTLYLGRNLSYETQGYSPFYDKKVLASVTISNNVTTICEYEFYGCTGLTSIEIPNSVTTIGAYAFKNCKSLTSIKSHITSDNLFIPGTDAFIGVNKTTCILYVPSGATETYEETSGWYEFVHIVELPAGTFDLAVSAAEYATLYLDFDAIIPEGVEVYIANSVNGNYLIMEQVTEILPANTAVIVRADEGTYTFTCSNKPAKAIEHNLLRGSVDDIYITPQKGAKYYVLSNKDGVVGMYLDALNGDTFKNNANKAYLVLKDNNLGAYDEEVNTQNPGVQLSNSYYFDFSGTTAIEPVVNEVEDNIYYDLNGRRVENPTRGIYILNGKKILVK